MVKTRTIVNFDFGCKSRLSHQRKRQRRGCDDVHMSIDTRGHSSQKQHLLQRRISVVVLRKSTLPGESGFEVLVGLLRRPSAPPSLAEPGLASGAGATTAAFLPPHAFEEHRTHRARPVSVPQAPHDSSAQAEAAEAAGRDSATEQPRAAAKSKSPLLLVRRAARAVARATMGALSTTLLEARVLVAPRMRRSIHGSTAVYACMDSCEDGGETGLWSAWAASYNAVARSVRSALERDAPLVDCWHGLPPDIFLYDSLLWIPLRDDCRTRNERHAWAALPAAHREDVQTASALWSVPQRAVPPHTPSLLDAQPFAPAASDEMSESRPTELEQGPDTSPDASPDEGATKGSTERPTERHKRQRTK
jgi:hypothetical protein